MGFNGHRGIPVGTPLNYLDESDINTGYPNLRKRHAKKWFCDMVEENDA
jgi:hypothetical protein